MLPLPSHFRLQDLTAITAPFFEYKVNLMKKAAKSASEEWFSR